MTSIADGAVIIQTSAESVPSTPSWFGEVALMATYRRRAQCSDKDQRGGALCTTAVRALRRDRFSRGALRLCHQRGTHPGSGSRQRLQPFSVPFMALFDREQLPARSTLSRFLAALTEAPVEALRTLFLDDLLSRSLTQRPRKREAWWIEQAMPGSSLTSMARVRRLGNVPCLRPKTYPRPFAGWMTFALPATKGASVDK